MTRGQSSDLFVLHFQIYPFVGCINWWYNCFGNRSIQQIGSCSYDGWVNGVEKRGYAEMQMELKIVLGLLERLMREGTKI